MHDSDESIFFGENSRRKRVVFAVTFLLTTFDVLTDWLNWKQWAVLGGYNQYEFFHVFDIGFLAVAAVGTILWALKIVIIVRTFPGNPHKDDTNDLTRSEDGKVKSSTQKKRAINGRNCLRIFNIFLLLMTGLLEDFPALLLIFYASSLPGCGTPTRYELGSAITMTTVVSSMLNATWTRILLAFELYGCFSCKDAHLPMVKKACKVGHYVTKTFSCKSPLASTGKLLLHGFISLLFIGNLSVGTMAIGQITRFTSFVPSGSYPVSLSSSVPTGPVGPGLDAKVDGAMFVYVHMKLPGFYRVTIYDKNNASVAQSMKVNQILNRLYIGQFDELSHLEYGTLVKAIPCSRIMPMKKKIDASAFIMDSSENADNVDFSQCKIILRMKYEANEMWNHFRKLNQDVLKSLTIDWGINIKDMNVRRIGVKPVSVDEFLTHQVQSDIVRYKCSSACGNDTDVCNQMEYGRFRAEQFDDKGAVRLAGLFLAINDLRIADSCFFPTEFKPSFEFFDESWKDVEPVEVPAKIQETYPQFITLPTFYQWEEDHLAAVPQNKCDLLWNEDASCCRI